MVPSEVTPTPPRRRAPAPGPPVVERLLEVGLLCCAGVSVVTTLGILLVLAGETVAFFREVGIARFLLDDQWTPLFAEPHFGIWPLVAGTVLTSGIAIAVALPLGLLAAIYLAELAPRDVRRLLKPLLEVLAGVPTLVYGTFALLVVTPALQRVIPDLSGFNALSPGLLMGLMILPLIASLSDDALRAVPRAHREGAWALGAGRLPTILRVVLPTARSGIVAAVALAIGRAVGETMIVAIAAGQEPRLTLDPRVPIETMTAFIVQVSLGDVAAGTLAHRTLFVVGAALFALTFTLNVIARRAAAATPGRPR